MSTDSTIDTGVVAGSRGGSFFGTLASKISRGYALRRRRAAFARLANLEQHILDDIGITRADIDYGMSLPLADNAALIVRERAAARRAGR